MKKIKKVFGYILNQNNLLVFEQPKYPESGIQVPAGTVENHESIEEAIIREIKEETGLNEFKIIEYLGKHEKNMLEYGKNEIHERHFFYLTTDENTEISWENFENFGGTENEKILFKFYWVNIRRIPKLIAEHNYMISKLLEIIE